MKVFRAFERGTEIESDMDKYIIKIIYTYDVKTDTYTARVFWKNSKDMTSSLIENIIINYENFQGNDYIENHNEAIDKIIFDKVYKELQPLFDYYDNMINKGIF